MSDLGKSLQEQIELAAQRREKHCPRQGTQGTVSTQTTKLLSAPDNEDKFEVRKYKNGELVSVEQRPGWGAKRAQETARSVVHDDATSKAFARLDSGGVKIIPPPLPVGQPAIEPQRRHSESPSNRSVVLNPNEVTRGVGFVSIKIDSGEYFRYRKALIGEDGFGSPSGKSQDIGDIKDYNITHVKKDKNGQWYMIMQHIKDKFYLVANVEIS